MARRQTDPDVLAAIEALALDGWRPPAIERKLSRFGDRVPSRRTLYSIVAEMQPALIGPRWSVADADTADAALILPVLAAVTRNSDGRMGHFTVETAAWIARMRRVAPSLPPTLAYRWAVRYQTATAAGRDTHELDRDLALDTEKHPAEG